jgi:class 3 adenylate cyclase
MFGDTINTAARMEQTGMPGKIHISPDTAALLSAAGKDEWITSRDDGTLSLSLNQIYPLLSHAFAILFFAI